MGAWKTRMTKNSRSLLLFTILAVIALAFTYYRYIQPKQQAKELQQQVLKQPAAGTCYQGKWIKTATPVTPKHDAPHYRMFWGTCENTSTLLCYHVQGNVAQPMADDSGSSTSTNPLMQPGNYVCHTVQGDEGTPYRFGTSIDTVARQACKCSE